VDPLGPRQGLSRGGAAITQRSAERTDREGSGLLTPVCLVDALHTRRRAIGLLIDSGDGLKVISEAAAADEAMSSLSSMARVIPNLVVAVCFGLPGEHDAPWLIGELRRRFPRLSIVACGALSDPVTVSQAILAGADGFLDMSASSEAFLDAVLRVGRGERALVGPTDWQETPDSLAGGVTARVSLSPREREVLSLAADGLTTRQIAGRLGIRDTTVSTHLARAYRKLGSGTRISAIRQALRMAMIPAPGQGPS